MFNIILGFPGWEQAADASTASTAGWAVLDEVGCCVCCESSKFAIL